MSTGWVWDERCAWYQMRGGARHVTEAFPVEPDLRPESAVAGVRRLRNLVEASGLLRDLVPIEARTATKDELLLVHTREYVEQVELLSRGSGGSVGLNSVLGPGSYELLQLAIGGLIEAVDAVVRGDVSNVYSLVFPCGHHAGPSEGGGGCVFATESIAVAHARAKRGLERVAIVDWDVHHGNGTQACFWDDPSVLTISLHQDNAWPPASGTVAERGGGDGIGANINIPLPPGSGVGAYEAALDRIVLPALAAHRPELILVVCGLDASADDPNGRQMLHSDGYRSLTRMIKQASDALCGGRLVVQHGGGYSRRYVPFCGLAVIEELSGIRTDVTDPFLEEFSWYAGQDLQPHQDAAITEAGAELTLLRG